MILWGRAAARCAHPSCRKQLINDEDRSGEGVLIGEVAHIVARNSSGPRGDKDPPGRTLDDQANLILLCRQHHTIVDRQPDRFPVPMLVQWKADHEAWVATQLFPHDQLAGLTTQADATRERVHSTLLPIQHIPTTVHLAECTTIESEVRQSIDYGSLPSGLMAPFIIRDGNLLTFCDLDDESNPFVRVVDPYSTEAHHAEVWWDDPDLRRRYVELLNRSLNKLTGRLRLNFDKDHRRYYFGPASDGQPRQVQYTSMGGRRQTRKVVWQPTIRKTAEKRHYWEHFAVGLRFHQTSKRGWCLSVRPERRFTRDGKEPLTPKGTGRRSTSRKSHMYNINVLTEVHFWRDYLSRGRPRIIANFGKQNLTISTELLATDVCWPKIPEDTHKYMNVTYEDDLFSLADHNEAIEFEDDHASVYDGLAVDLEYDDETA